MCGVVGVASIRSICSREWLGEGSKAIAHRGPDDVGEWWSPDGRVGLAHRRLAIVDLSSAGHQPMQTPDKHLTISFNGEIYNHRELRERLIEVGASFQSHTDTEVILAAFRQWQEGCLSFLNGMFAFAIHDATSNRIFLARDPAGEKPLFLYHANGELRFASELKALIADTSLSRRINSESLNAYLRQGFVPGDRCILDGFFKLPPGHAAYFDLESGKLTIWQYWKLPDYSGCVSQVSGDDEALLDELEQLLGNSVRQRIAADVPVGVLLSGGVDSSLVTALAARTTGSIKTFTVSFPGHGQFDEVLHARAIAQHFGTVHTELNAHAVDAALLTRLAHQFDEPIADSSMIPTFLVCELVRKHCTVVLGGDGGDELFGGYEHYRNQLWLKSRVGSVPLVFRKLIANAAQRCLPIGLKGRNWLFGIGADFRWDTPIVSSRFDDHFRKSLIDSQSYCELTAAVSDDRSASIVNEDLLQRLTRHDFGHYLAEDILVKVDRASMLNSLEVRAPLLDRFLVEFAFEKVPSELKATARERKLLLKRLSGRVLPKGFDANRKQGFSVPIGRWLMTPMLRRLTDEVLLDSNCTFKRPAVLELINGMKRGRSNGERVFSLLLFELWRREFGAVL